jgi:hypothetical protein
VGSAGAGVEHALGWAELPGGSVGRTNWTRLQNRVF